MGGAVEGPWDGGSQVVTLARYVTRAKLSYLFEMHMNAWFAPAPRDFNVRK